jgi:L-alanine-DL-glutamate epimerase-like enolase superfamily enzyme
MTSVKYIRYYEVVRPLRVTFATAQGLKNVMRSVILQVTLTDGSTGLGECPTSVSLSQETIWTIKGILDEVSETVKDMPIDEYHTLIAELRKRYPHHPMSISGLEVALFRASLANKGATEHIYWGGKARTIQTDITIPFVLDEAFLTHWMKHILRKGFTKYKLKVSGNVEQDKKILSFVYNRLQDTLEGFTICLDGNQAYTKKTFRQIIDYIQNEGLTIEFFEQPLAKDDFHGSKEVKKFTPFPIILDEAVITGSDTKRIAEEGLADGINIKLAKSGISESASILNVARKHGLKLMIGCMTETMIGLSAAVYLATGTGAFEYIDLDAVFLLHHKNKYGNISLQGPCFTLQPV